LKNFAKNSPNLTSSLTGMILLHWVKDLVQFKTELLSKALLNSDQLNEKSPGIGVNLCTLELSV